MCVKKENVLVLSLIIWFYFLWLLIYFLWFNHSHSLTPTQAGLGRESEGYNGRKLVSCNTERLLGKAKAVHVEKNKEWIHCSHGQAGVQLSPGEQGPVTRNSDWEDKCHHSMCSSLLSSLSLHLTCWAWCHMIWNIPLIHLGHLFCLCLLLCTLSPLTSMAVPWHQQ